MWLINSSIGRKLIMSLSGIMLVLFLLFHGLMNVVVIFSADAYNAICAFLGANWYALIATKGLALGFMIHIAYALFLSFQNMKARGSNRYAVTDKQENVTWSSQNMLVLGAIVLGFLALHLYHFWSKMQLVEIGHKLDVHLGDIDKAIDGAYWITHWFSQPVYATIYLVWLAALWFHLTHGVWSALHSLGLNNQTWLPRVKCGANIFSTLVVLLFASVVVYTYVYQNFVL
ncbi:MAG: succinate dehydrogenase/fumarate reductase cytochrome b subunit [Paludibacteraceae bacterium]|nr:succinate dehydrogenase/fumarate reductase cytochrome b subunit [Paludibacteraceae bacterium]